MRIHYPPSSVFHKPVEISSYPTNSRTVAYCSLESVPDKVQIAQYSSVKDNILGFRV